MEHLTYGAPYLFHNIKFRKGVVYMRKKIGYRSTDKRTQREKRLLESDSTNDSQPKVVVRKYHITSQTAYHITQLALMENTSEGRVLDKIIRTYMATRQKTHKGEMLSCSLH